MTDEQARRKGPDGEPARTANARGQTPWQAPRIVDYGSIRHLVRKGTGALPPSPYPGSGSPPLVKRTVYG